MTDLNEAEPVAVPTGDDLALSRDTDFFHVADHLDDSERRLLARVRKYCDAQVVPLANDFARHHTDIEAVYTYEGTDSIQSLIVGRAITGISAFV